MPMFRARFGRHILVEFLPPATTGLKHSASSQGRVIILCDGMPSIPRKQALAEFLAARGYWVFYPRYRGAWESGGEFLARSPHLDILDVVSGLRREIRELAFGEKFRVRPAEIFVIGGSFGGAAAILSSLDRRVHKVIANCPVVDWSILRESEETETSNRDYAAYIRAAFGPAYRLSQRNWKKLYTGRFYNPVHHAGDIDSTKILMFHAQDDPHVPYRSVQKFAQLTGVKLNLFRRGGHLSTDAIVRSHWTQIRRFFEGGSTGRP